MNFNTTLAIKEPRSLWRTLWQPWGIALLLALLLLGGGLYRVNGATQACEDVNNVTICFDTFEDIQDEGIPLNRIYHGNVTIARKGQAPLLKVQASATSNAIQRMLESGNLPNTLFDTGAAGELLFIADPAQTPLVRTIETFDAACPADSNGQKINGRFKVDTQNAKIILPPPTEYNIQKSACPFFKNKPTGFDLLFLERYGLNGFFQSEEKKRQNLAQATYEFDLTTGKFIFTAPIDIKLTESSENPDFRITLRAEVDKQGKITGNIDGFKLALGGLLLDASGVVFTAKNGNVPAFFEAATVKVLKTDNPDVPTLDPADPSVIFAFTKLRYADGTWSIGGAAVGIRDFVFGNAFRTTNQTVGIERDQASQTLFFAIRSTLEFGAVAESPTKLPITLKIARKVVNGQGKPIIEAGLQDIAPKLGVFTLKLKTVTLVGDAVTNFFGIKAGLAELQWPAHLGGKTAAGVNDFRLGIDKDKKLIFNLGGATVATPEYESGILKGTLAGTVAVVNEVVTFQLSGNLTLKIKENSAAGIGTTLTVRAGSGVCAEVTATSVFRQSTTPTNCLKRLEMKLAGFAVKVAGFTFSLTNPRGLDDGGFAVDQATFTLPTGINTQGLGGGTGFVIQQFAVHGNGDIEIGGGGFELAPIKIGDFQFVGLKGSFLKTPTGLYEFKAAGKFPLPSIEPGANSPGISAEITIRTLPGSGLAGGGVQVFFQAIPGTGIPIGTTGFELTGLGGGFDVNQGTVKINVSMKASSLLRIPPPFNFPLATVNGGATLQVKPFSFSANAELSVLIFKVAQAQVGIGAGFGFDGVSPGFFVTFQVDKLLQHGGAALRIAKVTVNGQQKLRVLASANFDLGIQKGLLVGALPREDRFFAGIRLTGGHFNDTRKSPTEQVLGLKGELQILGFTPSVGVFFNPGSGDPTIVGLNLDKFVPINSGQVRAAAANGEQGFGSRALSATEVQALGLVVAAADVEAGAIKQETIPVVVTQTTQLGVGLTYATGAPVLRLRLPDNSELTPATVNGTSQRYTKEVTATETIEMFVLDGAPVGTYQLIIDNAPADYESLIYHFNETPKAQITGVTCGGAAVVGVTVSCNNVPSSGTAVTMNWTTSDSDSANLHISVGYVPVTGTNSTPEPTLLQPLAEELATGPGSFTWNLAETPSGNYRLALVVDDGANPAVTLYSNELIVVTDQRAPAVPSGLTGTPQAGELLVQWHQNSERDLAGYEIGFGIVNDGNPDTPENFLYSRDMGPKEVVTGTSNIVDGKLWGLDDNVAMYYSLRAYDVSGNFSAWAPIQVGKPWPLAPNAWLPTPGSTAVDVASTIDVAFATPMNRASVTDAITIVDAKGNPVAGDLFFVMDLNSEKVVGLSLQPKQRLAAETLFNVTVKGGASGVTAEDGRQMPADYQWSFTTGAAAQAQLFLPLAVR